MLIMYSLDGIEQDLFKVNGKFYIKLLKVIALRRQHSKFFMNGTEDMAPFNLVMFTCGSLSRSS